MADKECEGLEKKHEIHTTCICIVTESKYLPGFGGKISWEPGVPILPGAPPCGCKSKF